MCSSDLQTFDFPARLARYIPQAFQKGQRPYLFVLAWLAMSLVLMLMIFTPDDKLFAPRLFIFVLVFTMYLLLQLGASESLAVNVVLAGLSAQIIYICLMTGGVFSPRLIWINLAPLVAFYTLGKKQGFIWLGLGLVSFLGLAICSVLGVFIENPVFDQETLRPSFILYSTNLLAVSLIPFLYKIGRAHV